jgi:hypothetical protein
VAKVMITGEIDRNRLRPRLSKRFITATPARHYSFDYRRVPRAGLTFRHNATGEEETASAGHQ